MNYANETMKKSLFFLICVLALGGAQTLRAQTVFDVQRLRIESSRREQTKAVKFGYDVDFHYFFDVRRFGSSSDLFMLSEVLNVARLTPTVNLSFSQNRNITHRLVTGIDVIKDLGENPIVSTYYSDDEDRLSLMNAYLFKELLIYYNLKAASDRHSAELYAGIFPRTLRSGYYSLAMFSDADMLYNPNIEGFMLKYENRKLLAEAGIDCLGYKALDRRLAYMAFTSGLYKPLKWASIGWDGTYTSVGSSYLIISGAQSLLFNPYIKLEAGHLLKMQDLSLKAGGMISYQHYSNVVEESRMPMGVEVISNIRHWNFGIENTFFYGDNMMPFRNSSFMDGGWTSTNASTLYKGERFYFTRRGYAAIYDRLELYFQPNISRGLDLRLSAVGHFINGTEAVNSFLGWQAKASLLFNLGELTQPVRHIFGNTDAKKSKTVPRRNGPSIRL